MARKYRIYLCTRLVNLRRLGIWQDEFQFFFSVFLKLMIEFQALRVSDLPSIVDSIQSWLKTDIVYERSRRQVAAAVKDPVAYSSFLFWWRSEEKALAYLFPPHPLLIVGEFSDRDAFVAAVARWMLSNQVAEYQGTSKACEALEAALQQTSTADLRFIVSRAKLFMTCFSGIHLTCPDEFKVRTMFNSDIHTLKIFQAEFLKDVDLFTNQAESDKQIEKYVKEGLVHVLVCSDSAEVLAGMAIMLPEDGSSMSRLTSVYISRSFRGKGLAKALVSAAVVCNEERGYNTCLYINAEKPATVHVYKSVGFKEHAQYSIRRFETIQGSRKDVA